MTKKKTTPNKSDSGSTRSSRTASKAKRSTPRKKSVARKPAVKQKRKAPPKKKSSAGRQSSNSTQKKKAKVNRSKKTNSKKTDGLGTEAIRIVEQAASILEQEISAGIVAAKKVEERYVNVDALRTSSPGQVIQRFRTDAHEVLDIVLDMINLSINAVGGMSGRVMNVRSTTAPSDGDGKSDSNPVIELEIAEILKPGSCGQVGMLVDNNHNKATGKFSFATAGLLSDDGDMLEAKQITFDPPELEIAAHDMEKVSIKVLIPRSLSPGKYSGVIQAPALQMRALLSVQVEN